MSGEIRPGSFFVAAASSSMKLSTTKILCVGPDAAPPPGGETGRLITNIVHEDVRNVVRHLLRGAVDGIFVETVYEGRGRPTRQDRGGRDAVMVSDQLVLRIEAGGEPVVVVGSIDVVLDVLFAAPDDLHRAIDLLRDRDGLGNAVDVEPRPKPPPSR